MTTLRESLRPGDPVVVGVPTSTYDYGITVPAGTVGLIASTHVPAVLRNTFSEDEFACVDFLLCWDDLGEAQRAEMIARMQSSRKDTVTPEMAQGAFAFDYCLAGPDGRRYRHFRVAADYRTLRRAPSYEPARWLPQAFATLWPNSAPDRTSWWPLDSLQGRTRDEVLSHLSAIAPKEA